MLATDAPSQSIVQIRRGMGYAQYGGFPFVMRSTFHISPDEYKRRKETGWPEVAAGTFEAREVQVKSVLDEFKTVEPFGSPTSTPPPGPHKATSSGADDLLSKTFEKQAAKRSKYQKPTDPSS